MKRLLLAPLLLGLIPSANAGIYIYPFFNKGIDSLALKLLKLIDMNFSQFLPPSGEIK